MSENTDDFFGDQETDDKALRDREWDALRREHVIAGYREGSERGHETKMQDGFDEGFLAGAKATADAGYWLGVSAVIGAFYTHGKGAEQVDKHVAKDDILAIKEAREELEEKANQVEDGGPPLDISTTRELCKKILELLPKEEVEDSEKRTQSGERPANGT